MDGYQNRISVYRGHMRPKGKMRNFVKQIRNEALASFRDIKRTLVNETLQAFVSTHVRDIE